MIFPKNKFDPSLHSGLAVTDKKGNAIINLVEDIEAFLKKLVDWAIFQEDIIGVFLVGSYARNSFKETSDVDLVIITQKPDLYLKDDSWIGKFGYAEKIMDEHWGLLKTKRVFYKNGFEIEYNFTTADWIKIPADEGTKKVLTDGNKILLDRTGQLRQFLDKLA